MLLDAIFWPIGRHAGQHLDDGDPKASKWKRTQGWKAAQAEAALPTKVSDESVSCAMLEQRLLIRLRSVTELRVLFVFGMSDRVAHAAKSWLGHRMGIELRKLSAGQLLLHPTLRTMLVGYVSLLAIAFGGVVGACRLMHICNVSRCCVGSVQQ